MDVSVQQIPPKIPNAAQYDWNHMTKHEVIILLFKQKIL